MPFQRRTRLCDACQANISNLVRIKCGVCSDVELCVECFAQGKEPSTHRAGHSYRVMDRLTFPILDADWGADEELLFIDGLAACGMGNWAGVSDHVGTKTKEQCEAHYLEVYVHSSRWPRPMPLDDFDDIADTIQARKKIMLSARDDVATTLKSQPSNHEIVGYMPGRLEFEHEYENEAENLVKDIAFYEDDADDDIELKVTLLDIYNSKLDRRAKRKELIFGRDLLEYRKNQAAERKLEKEDRDLLNRCKVFAKMMTKDDFDKFIEGLISEYSEAHYKAAWHRLTRVLALPPTDERRIRRRIAELQEYRQNGVRTESGSATYERQKEQRLSATKYMVARDTYTLGERTPRPNSRYTPTRESTPPSVSQKTIGRKPANPLDITEADGVHLLTTEEQDLCSALRIYPKPYLVIKETILNEYTRRGTLRRRQARELIKIDVNKTSRIYDFFLNMGWIRQPSKEQQPAG
ncbi:hypothetical protein THASP1DRAFT_27477 [Thamnocephalis sphaerospora]|uniref:Transcriptional adapter 2 n=1 Tax=Thamnocephalis sphaerospora TaxID=78915 RepID=A0A4V1IXD9_9FUNG|nr:hypothetical protein THASP1DRAFT_27477 [Thamnocephalis sphaerospora]|eukprot:RKP10719.1 hypothetical protein THASP1DRAFT_27477 [Thamnocephalis sphaerospora]